MSLSGDWTWPLAVARFLETFFKISTKDVRSSTCASGNAGYIHYHLDYTAFCSVVFFLHSPRTPSFVFLSFQTHNNSPGGGFREEL